MVYPIRIKRSAVKDLERLAAADRARVAAAIDRLAGSPHQGSVLKGSLRGLRRIRVGRYRVVYEVQEEVLVVLVIRVALRSRAYRPSGRAGP